MDINKRIRQTEKDIKSFMQKSLDTMLEKNRQRGDCWRNSGLLGQFIEIHSMYYRLRNLIYDMDLNEIASEEWISQVKNALEDMRNFTILGELCLIENNFKGDKYAESDKILSV